MSTTATIVEAKQSLVTAITTALATSGANGGQVPVHYAWEPSAQEECVFLGRPSLLEGEEYVGRTSVTSSPLFAEAVLPVNASYLIEGTCWSWQPHKTPADGPAAEARVEVLWAAVNASLAVLSWVGEQTAEFQLRPFQKGWVGLAPFTVQVHSLLT